MNRLSPLRLSAAAAALLGLAACAGAPAPVARLAAPAVAPETAPLSGPLAAMAKPRAPLTGDISATNLIDGAPVTLRARASGDTVRVVQSDGCAWTRWGDWFAPSDSWANCGESQNWHTGQATVRPVGSLWPLRPGAEAGYVRNATSHTGRTYTRETRCRVTGSEAVIRPSGAATPAHVVACADGKRVRTTWFAEGEGPVAFRAVHEENGVEEAWVRN
ncbi:MAG: hypothetical protein ACE37J_09030 [Pikeienuella sp.]|uniref:hypothetical protein n=1 Tax=Pikeienuella sp. TaxID=2831957 RepID=UPI00391AE453